MTDDRLNSSERRLDLRALDAALDDERTEAVVAAVMSRIASEMHGTTDDITRLLQARRRMMFVAAALAGLAAVAMFAFPQRPGASSGADPISAWSQSSHVPTNGELLAVFQGYRP